MTRGISGVSLAAIICCYTSLWPAFGQQINQQDIQQIQDTAAKICNTITEAKGRKSDLQLQGDVKAQLGGLVGKITGGSGVSGTGQLTNEEFEGLSRDATAAALQDSRGCRERVFNKMFDKLSQPAEKKSDLNKADTIIAAMNLGYHVEKAFSPLNQPKNFYICHLCWWEQSMYNCASTTLSLRTVELSTPPVLSSGYGNDFFKNLAGNIPDCRLLMTSMMSESDRANEDAEWLHIQPYNFRGDVQLGEIKAFRQLRTPKTLGNDAFSFDKEIKNMADFNQSKYKSINDFFRKQMTQIVTKEAYETGACIVDVYMTMKGDTTVEDNWIAEFGYYEYRLALDKHLRSLGIEEKSKELPITVEEAKKRRFDPEIFIASLEGALRQIWK